MAYQHYDVKFADAGLHLNLPTDLVPPGVYSRLTNVVPKVEGRLEGRDGLTLIREIVASTTIHSIFRLNQEVPSVVGERLVGIGTAFYTAPFPAGSVFTALCHSAICSLLRNLHSLR